MGQSINVLLYGARVPDGVNVEDLREKWEEVVSPKVEAYEARLRKSANERTRVRRWGLARQAYVPETPCPDDADPDNLIGFYICRGDNDDAESHRFPAMTRAEMRESEAAKRSRRRWARFARWARAQGVEFGKPRMWRTRTEVA